MAFRNSSPAANQFVRFLRRSLPFPGSFWLELIGFCLPSSRGCWLALRVPIACDTTPLRSQADGHDDISDPVHSVPASVRRRPHPLGDIAVAGDDGGTA